MDLHIPTLMLWMFGHWFRQSISRTRYDHWAESYTPSSLHYRLGVTLPSYEVSRDAALFSTW